MAPGPDRGGVGGGIAGLFHAVGDAACRLHAPAGSCAAVAGTGARRGAESAAAGAARRSAHFLSRVPLGAAPNRPRRVQPGRGRSGAAGQPIPREYVVADKVQPGRGRSGAAGAAERMRSAPARIAGMANGLDRADAGKRVRDAAGGQNWDHPSSAPPAILLVCASGALASAPGSGRRHRSGARTACPPIRGRRLPACKGRRAACGHAYIACIIFPTCD